MNILWPTADRRKMLSLSRDTRRACKEKKKGKKTEKEKKHLSFEFAIRPVYTYKYTYTVSHCHSYKYVRYLLDLILFIRLSYIHDSLCYLIVLIFIRVFRTETSHYIRKTSIEDRYLYFTCIHLFYFTHVVKVVRERDKN